MALLDLALTLALALGLVLASAVALESLLLAFARAVLALLAGLALVDVFAVLVAALALTHAEVAGIGWSRAIVAVALGYWQVPREAFLLAVAASGLVAGGVSVVVVVVVVVVVEIGRASCRERV